MLRRLTVLVASAAVAAGTLSVPAAASATDDPRAELDAVLAASASAFAEGIASRTVTTAPSVAFEMASDVPGVASLSVVAAAMDDSSPADGTQVGEIGVLGTDLYGTDPSVTAAWELDGLVGKLAYVRGDTGALDVFTELDFVLDGPGFGSKLPKRVQDAVKADVVTRGGTADSLVRIASYSPDEASSATGGLLGSASPAAQTEQIFELWPQSTLSRGAGGDEPAFRIEIVDPTLAELGARITADLYVAEAGFLNRMVLTLTDDTETMSATLTVTGAGPDLVPPVWFNDRVISPLATAAERFRAALSFLNYSLADAAGLARKLAQLENEKVTKRHIRLGLGLAGVLDYDAYKVRGVPRGYQVTDRDAVTPKAFGPVCLTIAVKGTQNVRVRNC